MIVWGWRRGGEIEWRGVLQCAHCDQWAVHYGIQIKRTFTFFFIPLIPLWSDTNVICGACEQETKLGPVEYAEARALAEENYAELLATEERRLARRESEGHELAEGSTVGELPSYTPPSAGECGACGATLDVSDTYCTECGERA